MSKLLLAVSVVLAGAAGGGISELIRGSEARAAAPKAAEVGRYQISSYGFSIPNPANSADHRSGAFILDTETGDLYHTITGTGTRKIGTLPR
jgi:hypothetical protein